MGKIIVSMYLSLDGVMEEPAWTAPYFNEEVWSSPIYCLKVKLFY
ncbi:hypothetical protein bcgnr5386_16890 [Bacillus cereus]